MKIVVALEGLTFYAFHGFYDEEQKSGNNFIVDVKITSSIDDASDFEDLSNSINYEEVYAVVNQVMIVPSRLLENVANKIIDSIGCKWKTKTVEVSIAKLSAPVGGPCNNARVTLKKKFN